MRDVVIVPCYERPEYTFLCLQYLSRARGIHDKDVWICQDQHKDTGPLIVGAMLEVRDRADCYFIRLRYQLHARHDTYGNSQNLVDSLRDAYDTGAERVFLVEDDIIVAPDIFEWHEEVLEHSEAFVSCATALNKSAHFPINGPQVMNETYQDPNAYLKVCGPYSSHAVAFKRKYLKGLLDSLIIHKPFEWESGKEQDIYIQKLSKATDRTSAWPYVPRAYNVGWRSYHINTGVKFNGTLEEKTNALESVIRDPQKLREMSANNSAVTALPEQWPVRTGPVVNVQKFR